MKYADGPTVEVDTLVARADRPSVGAGDRHRAARQVLVRVRRREWLDDGPRLSARFVGRNHHEAHRASGRRRPRSPGTSRAVRSGGTCPIPRTRRRAGGSSSSRNADGVRLRQGARIGPAPSGLTIAITAMPDKEERIIARRLEEFERNMQATLEGIKQLAEATE